MFGKQLVLCFWYRPVGIQVVRASHSTRYTYSGGPISYVWGALNNLPLTVSSDCEGSEVTPVWRWLVLPFEMPSGPVTAWSCIGLWLLACLEYFPAAGGIRTSLLTAGAGRLGCGLALGFCHLCCCCSSLRGVQHLSRNEGAHSLVPGVLLAPTAELLRDICALSSSQERLESFLTKLLARRCLAWVPFLTSCPEVPF